MCVFFCYLVFVLIMFVLLFESTVPFLPACHPPPLPVPPPPATLSHEDAGGESWCVITANTTALSTRIGSVWALPGHVIAVQETRLSAWAQEHYQSLLQDKGWSTAWGKPRPWLLNPWNARAGGVGIFARPD